MIPKATIHSAIDAALDAIRDPEDKDRIANAIAASVAQERSASVTITFLAKWDAKAGCVTLVRKCKITRPISEHKDETEKLEPIDLFTLRHEEPGQTELEGTR